MDTCVIRCAKKKSYMWKILPQYKHVTKERGKVGGGTISAKGGLDGGLRECTIH